MSRSPCHWTLSCLPSSLLSSSFNFFKIFFWAIQPIHHTHTHTISKNHLSPAAWRPKKKIFFNIQGRQVAGESSDLLGCVCVCCVCVCRLVVPFHFLCLSSLSLSSHCHFQFSYHCFFSFPTGAALLKKVSYLSIHPSLIHSLVIQLLALSFSLYVLYLWPDWTVL